MTKRQQEQAPEDPVASLPVEQAPAARGHPALATTLPQMVRSTTAANLVAEMAALASNPSATVRPPEIPALTRPRLLIRSGPPAPQRPARQPRRHRGLFRMTAALHRETCPVAFPELRDKQLPMLQATATRQETYSQAIRPVQRQRDLFRQATRRL